MNLAKTVALAILLIVIMVMMVAHSPDIPRIDASSDPALRNSLSNVRRGLGDKELKRFEDDCAYLILRTTYQGGRGKLPQTADFFKKLHGNTAAEVRKQADFARSIEEKTWNGTGQAQDKAEADDKADQASADSSKDATPPPPRKSNRPRPTLGQVPRPDPKLVPDPNYVVRPGDFVQLFDPKGGTIIVCSDDATIAAYWQATRANDQDGIDELLNRGKAFEGENGTRVEVLEYVVDPTPVLMVHLSNGGSVDKTGWVLATDAAKLVFPSDLAGTRPKSPPVSLGAPTPPPLNPVATLEARAQALLEDGIAKEQANLPGRARTIYEGLKRDFPTTKAAAKAQKQIDALNAKKKVR